MIGCLIGTHHLTCSRGRRSASRAVCCCFYWSWYFMPVCQRTHKEPGSGSTAHGRRDETQNNLLRSERRVFVQLRQEPWKILVVVCLHSTDSWGAAGGWGGAGRGEAESRQKCRQTQRGCRAVQRVVSVTHYNSNTHTHTCRVSCSHFWLCTDRLAPLLFQENKNWSFLYYF